MLTLMRMSRPSTFAREPLLELSSVAACMSYFTDFYLPQDQEPVGGHPSRETLERGRRILP